MNRIAVALVLALTLVGSTGCNTSNCAPDLEGTATSDFNLCYDRVTVEVQLNQGTPTNYRISYLRDTTSPPEIPVRVIVAAPAQVNTAIDMTATGNSVSRVTLNGVQFQAVGSGSLTFGSLGDVGQNVSGEFTVGFVDQSGTLIGSFSEDLVEFTF